MVDKRIIAYVILTAAMSYFITQIFWPNTGTGPKDLSSFYHGASQLLIFEALVFALSLVAGLGFFVFSILNTVFVFFIIYFFWPLTGNAPPDMDSFWSGYAQLGLINGMAFVTTLLAFKKYQKGRGGQNLEPREHRSRPLFRRR